ncbi:EamA family transporter [Lactiplantibacillus mudanjiangensis]|uniref:EamA family transporter n=1 Tax=Lactiplantibacillus mudanjiangensis TaxID=1296538 RepID=UPI0010309986|nr:DMT family transporter [Lactiplantibacillus mudanjiangensis]
MKRLAPIMVALGAISYGVPATLFKLANRAGVENGPLLFWSFLSSAIVLTVIQLVHGQPLHQQTADRRQIGWVLLAGTASGFTNTFYMLALQTIPVAVAAVMLMQSVWLSVLLGALVQHRRPTRMQVLSIIVVLIGTVLAADLLPVTAPIAWSGLGLSFLAAVAYAVTIQATASLGNQLQPLTKTWLLGLGALGLITVVWGPQLLTTPVTLAAIKWGGITAFFSLVLPLACYSFFMPQLALGVGPILSSLELPASIVVAYLVLREPVSGWQLVGVGLIILAVIVSNRWSAKRVSR